MKKKQIEAIRRQAKANQQRKDERKSQWETAKKEAEAIIEARKFNHICGKEMQKVPKPSDTTAALIPCVMCDGFLKQLPHWWSFPKKCAMKQDIEHFVDYYRSHRLEGLQEKGEEYRRKSLQQLISDWEKKQYEIDNIIATENEKRWCEINCEWWKAEKILEVLRGMSETKPQPGTRTNEHFKTKYSKQALKAAFEDLTDLDNEVVIDGTFEDWLYICTGEKSKPKHKKIDWRYKSKTLLVEFVKSIFAGESNIWVVTANCFTFNGNDLKAKSLNKLNDQTRQRIEGNTPRGWDRVELIVERLKTPKK